MKTQEELNELKEEYQALTLKLKELSDDELKIVTGGFETPDYNKQFEINVYGKDTPNFEPPSYK